MDDIRKMYFSQTALRTYLGCPYRFKNRYIDGLYWRFDSGGAKRGSEFHLDMKRHFLGLPTSGQNEELVSAAAAFLPIEKGKEYMPEFTLRYIAGDIRLTARYDLLVVGEDVKIYDWKMESARPDPLKLKGDIQTRLYLYVLAAAGEKIKESIQPSDISITYFNPLHPSSPVRIGYDSSRFHRDGIYLSGLINRIIKDTQYKPTDDKRKCAYCEYNRLCNGESVSFEKIEDADMDLAWDDIEEISF